MPFSYIEVCYSCTVVVSYLDYRVTSNWSVKHHMYNAIILGL